MFEEIEGGSGNVGDMGESLNKFLLLLFLCSDRFVLKNLKRFMKGIIVIIEVIKLDMGLGNVKIMNLRVLNLLCFVCNFSNINVMEVINDVNNCIGDVFFDNEESI